MNYDISELETTEIPYNTRRLPVKTLKCGKYYNTVLMIQ